MSPVNEIYNYQMLIVCMLLCIKISLYNLFFFINQEENNQNNEIAEGVIN